MHATIGTHGIKKPKSAAAQKRVRRRAVGKSTARMSASGQVVFGDMHGMPEDAAWSHEASLIVDIQIACTVGKKGFDPACFLFRFQKMRLHEKVRRRIEQGAGEYELFFRACGSETRRHRIKLASLTVPPVDQVASLVISLLCRVSQEIWRVAVHQHFTRNHACIALA